MSDQSAIKSDAIDLNVVLSGLKNRHQGPVMTTVKLHLRTTHGAQDGVLLRIISVLNGRGASVQGMEFCLDPSGQGRLSAQMELRNTTTQTLQKALCRIVQVLDVHVSEPPAARNSKNAPGHNPPCDIWGLQ